MKHVDLGLVKYNKALEMQLDAVTAVQNGEEDTVFYCSHPPVVTLGRSASDSEVSGWQGEVVKVSRGGRATFHGPKQVIVYPIINLDSPHIGIKSKDLHSYLRALENWVIDSIADFGVQSEAKTLSKVDNQGRKLSLTGVWVGPKKVASIGIAVKKWVSYHGVAINLNYDPEAHKGIQPCGFQSDIMTDLATQKGEAIDRSTFIKVLQERAGLYF